MLTRKSEDFRPMGLQMKAGFRRNVEGDQRGGD